MIEIKEVVKAQKSFFSTANPIPVSKRIEVLLKLKKLIKNHHEEIGSAIYQDLRRPLIETLAAELSTLISEIDYTVRNLSKWAAIKKVRTSLINFPSKGHIHPSAKGMVLVIGAWNYPLALTLRPAISALAAGNTVIIAPSSKSQNMSKLLKRLVNSNFPKDHLYVLEGTAERKELLLKEDFDHIFFTGSKAVGKRIMRIAADHLTPITLELGGKSPTIVNNDAPVHIAAQRIVWGKFINAGQTCIAPDYILVHESVYNELIDAMVKFIKTFYTTNPIASNDFCRIVDEEHFDKLKSLLEGEEIIYGGESSRDELLIGPTLIASPKEDSLIMHEEIFGPILPILKYKNENEIKEIISKSPTPLALYIFTRSKSFSHKMIDTIQFGGACINDTLLQVSEHTLPFGGVKLSGIGMYHGKAGFDTFTHYKSVMRRGVRTFFDFRFAPYNERMTFALKKFLRL